MQSAPFELNNEVVRAGAGAGKTTELVRRVVDTARDWKASKGQYPRLVVTTFTRKATQELRDRLVVEACRRQDAELLDYVVSRSRLHISTIHGVLSLFIRRYGHLIGLDANFAILSEDEAEQRRRRILRRVLVEQEAEQVILQTYSLEQVLSMCSDYHVHKLEHPDLRPASEGDFLEACAERLAPLVEKLRAVLSEIQSQTSDGKWLGFVAAVGSLLGELVNPLTLDRLERAREKLENLPSKPPLRKDKPAISENTDKKLRSLRENLSKELQRPAMDSAIWPDFFAAQGLFVKLAEGFSSGLLAEVEQTGKIEMSDLEHLVLKSLRGSPELGAVFAEEWDYWLIDEYQDTSPVQVEILSHLVGARPSFAVGDPQQSIYLFRGARMEVFAEREENLRRQGFEPGRKLINYRSRPELLLFLNDFFKGLPGEFSPMQARAEVSAPQQVVARFYPASLGDHGSKREDEYAAIVAEIHRLLALPGVELSDICILARKNRVLTELAQHLKKLGFPTHVHAAKGYYGRREVRDALALLKFLVHPHDNFNLILLLRSPWFRIPDRALAKTLKSRKGSHWQQILSSELKNTSVVGELEKLTLAAQQWGYGSAWERGLTELGVFDFCSHHDPTGRRESNLWKLVHTLREAERQPGFQVLDFVARGFAVRDSEGSSEEGDAVTAIEPNSINLMTVHAAKGLQRKHVLIPHCDEEPRVTQRLEFAFAEGREGERGGGAWSIPVPVGEEGDLEVSPLALRAVSVLRERELAEQDRLLYVAMTRAQESLFISWTGPAKANSWAGRWTWPTGEVGLFPGVHYAFEVLGPPPPPQPYRGREVVLSEVRRPLHPLDFKWLNASTGDRRLATVPGGTYSVTSLLEEPVEGAGGGGGFRPPRRPVSERVQRVADGVLIHRLMEVRRYHSAEVARAELKRLFPERVGSLEEAFDFVERLKEPPMAELLLKGQVEWGVQLLTRQGILEAQVDLWGVVDKTLWVVDYKTGSVDYAEKAFRQLEIYAYVLRQLHALSHVRLAVIFPLAGEVAVRDYPGDATVLEQFPMIKRL